MDENKKNNNLEALKDHPAHKNFQSTLNILKSFDDVQKAIASIPKTSDAFNSIIKELEQRNIDVELICALELSKILKLYNLSNRTGLTFADLTEDSLKMFGEINYEQAVAYLESLNKRKEQIVKNDLKNFSIEGNLIEDLEHIEDNVGHHIKLKIEEYEQGKIVLTEQEKKLLAALKESKLLTNKELAKKLGYSVRNIEEICAKVRRNFEIDFVDNKLAKRHLLLDLAKHIAL